MFPLKLHISIHFHVPITAHIRCSSDFFVFLLSCCYMLFSLVFLHMACAFENVCRHLSSAVDRLCVCVFSSTLFLPLVSLCLSFIIEQGRGARLEIKEASRETEWAVTLRDAICYPQRIASGLLTCSIHLSTLALIKQMPVDIWLSRNEFLPLWAGDLLSLSPSILCDLLGLGKHTHTHS